MDIKIRLEQENDWYETELITKKAFWNLYKPGCDEHFLVHKLRSDPAYLPEISRVAEYGGKVIGMIMYSKSRIVTQYGEIGIITFGPLCVDPEYQKKGVGSALLNKTLKLAKEQGYLGIIIYGEPEYYPRFGFKTCDHFGITTPDGTNFSAFMGLELVPDGFKNASGKFFESEVFENLNPEDVDEYDRKFPFMEKLKLPGQWA
jgi:predicted N-acetyltransferase YhbS